MWLIQHADQHDKFWHGAGWGSRVHSLQYTAREKRKLPLPPFGQWVSEDYLNYIGKQSPEEPLAVIEDIKALVFAATHVLNSATKLSCTPDKAVVDKAALDELKAALDSLQEKK